MMKKEVVLDFEEPNCGENLRFGFLFFILMLLMTIIGIFADQWPPAMLNFKNIRWFSPTWEVSKFNLDLLLQGKGGYATTLWAYLVFVSISTWFYLAGKLLLTKLLPNQEEISTIEIFALRWLTGSWVWAIIWMFLGLAGWLHSLVGLAVTFGGILAFAILFFFYLKTTIAKLPPNLKTNFILSKLDLTGVGLIVIFLWFLLRSTFLVFPQYYWDTRTHEMAVPGYYVAERALIQNIFNIYTYFPQNGEMLTVWALLSNSKEAAYLIILGSFAALILFLFGYLSRVTSRLLALCAITLLTFSIMGSWHITHIKHDLQTAIFLTLHWWALLTVFEEVQNNSKAKKLLFLAGFFGGIALGFKPIAVPAIAVTFFGVFLFFFFYGTNAKNIFTKLSFALKRELVFAFALLIPYSPWFLRNLFLTGNPLFPFLDNLFQPPYPWLQPPRGGGYSIVGMGPGALLEYFRNLTQFIPVGAFGKAFIWWGASAWLCLTSLVCLGKSFGKSVRWVTTMALSSLLISLFFSLKPHHHFGSIVFLFTISFGIALSKILPKTKKWGRLVIVSIMIIVSVKGVILPIVGNIILAPLSIFISGAPATQYLYAFDGGTPFLASVDETEWIHYLINKYTDVNDKVIFIGSVCPAGIKRKYYCAYSLAQQPVVHFAEKSKDSTQLRDELLSLGIHHIVYDPEAWKQFCKGDAVDEKPFASVNTENQEKILQLLTQHCQLRFEVPSTKLRWLTILSPEKKPLPPVPIDKDDIYYFPIHYLKLAKELQRNGLVKVAERLKEMVERSGVYYFSTHKPYEDLWK